MKNVCCNPLSVIKNPGKQIHSKRLFKVTAAYAQQYKTLKINAFICGTCKSRLEKRNCEEHNLSQIILPITPPTKTMIQKDVDYKPNSTTLIPFSPVNQVLNAAGKSPLSTRAARSKVNLIKKMEQVRGIVITVKNECKPIIPDVNSIDSKLLDALKIKFNTASKISEKVMILTVAAATDLSVQQTVKLFGCTKYMVQKERQLYLRAGIMTSPNPKPGKTLSPEVVKIVLEFYESDEVSRQLPGRRDYVRVTDSSGEIIEKQKRMLLNNHNELYALFKEMHGDLKIGRSKFIQLRPAHCVMAGAPGTTNVCVCTYHQNPKLMVIGAHLKQLTQKSKNNKLESYKDCLQCIVCDTNNEACMLSKCQSCPGYENLSQKITKLFRDNFIDEITYKQWQYVDRCNLLTLTVSSKEFITNLCDQLEKLKRHAFITKNQSDYYLSVKNELPEGTLLVIADFAENFACILQDASQASHWNNTLVTVHTFAAYYRENNELKVFSHVVISESTTHDTVAVHLFQGLFISQAKKKFGTKLKKIRYFSDGAASQYKNRYNFLNLTFHQQDFGLEANWSFFGTSHGKNICDGIGGAVKRSVAQASLQRPYADQIQNAKDVYEFCINRPSKIVFDYACNKEHNNHNKIMKKRFKNALCLKGTQKVHYIEPTSVGAVRVKDYAFSNEFTDHNVTR